MTERHAGISGRGGLEQNPHYVLEMGLRALEGAVEPSEHLPRLGHVEAPAKRSTASVMAVETWERLFGVQRGLTPRGTSSR